ncbi:MAG: hypothetical protein V3T70_07200 [Phycisphaerae bacterium]
MKRVRADVFAAGVLAMVCTGWTQPPEIEHVSTWPPKAAAMPPVPDESREHVPATIDIAPVWNDQAIWEDGLAEMAYYDAVRPIYGTPRRYTRVHLLNRQWMDPDTGVKADQADAAGHVPVFKFNILEQIPTQNYNYRWQTTVFLRRPTLQPFKMVHSSQEWCGATFKHLSWKDAGLVLRSFSYFPGEGKREWRDLPPDAVPFEALFVIVRAAAAANADVKLTILPPMRSNREVAPRPTSATLRTAGDTHRVRTPLGRFEARRVTVTLADGVATFEVDTNPPHHLLKYEGPDGESLSLRFVERRPYWDRGSRSRFYAPGKAP